MATTTNDLAKALKASGHVNSLTQGRQMIGALVEEITKAVAGGEVVRITGLGAFKVKHMKAREGRNPATGQKIQIPAKKKVSISAAKALKDAVL